MLDWIEAHDGLAAWMQGLGTLVALALTVWAVLHEGGRADRARKAEVRRWVETCEDLIREIVPLVAGHRNEARVPSSALKPEVQDYRVALHELLETPFMQWPSSRLRAAVWRLNQDLDALRDFAQTHVELQTYSDEQTRQKWAVAYVSLQGALALTADMAFHATAEIRRDAKLANAAPATDYGRFHETLWRFSVDAPGEEPEA